MKCAFLNAGGLKSLKSDLGNRKAQLCLQWVLKVLKKELKEFSWNQEHHRLHQKKQGLENLFSKNCTVGILFVDDIEMRRLNKKFRGHGKTTDVLSFSGSEMDNLGELVFSLPRLKKQALENQHRILDEFIYLFVHGVLHLLGLDHEKSHLEERKMFRVQDAVFAKWMDQKKY